MSFTFLKSITESKKFLTVTLLDNKEAVYAKTCSFHDTSRDDLRDNAVLI